MSVEAEIQKSHDYFQNGGVNTSNININMQGDIYTVGGTVEDWNQLNKLGELIESSGKRVLNEVELEDLTPKNIEMTVTTKGSNLNVRSGAGTDFDIVGKFSNGNKVKVVRKWQEDWYEVQNDHVKGYCHTNYLS